MRDTARARHRYRRQVERRRAWLVEHSVRGIECIVTVRLGPEYHRCVGDLVPYGVHLGPVLRTVGSYTCAVTGSVLTDYHAVWRPTTPAEIVQVLGLPIEKLDPGILSLSPASLAIVVHLRRRAVNEERQRLGLPRLDWKAELAAQDERERRGT